MISATSQNGLAREAAVSRRPRLPLRFSIMPTKGPQVGGRDSTDRVLVDHIAKGDKLAMHALFAQHRLGVYRIVHRHVRDEGLAEDLVNEVFVDIWRNSEQFKGHSKVSTWIFAIARFKAMSALRRRRYEALDEAAAMAIPDGSDDPEVVLQKKDRVAILRECTSHLSHAHREIIDLFYYHEKTLEEVAKLTGVPRNTVKTRMFHARKRMSELLQAAGIDQTYQ